jgi:lipid A 3-O-deacylase
MGSRWGKFLVALSAGCALGLSTSHAEDGWDRPIFVFREENDATFSDRHYTQGLELRYLSGDQREDTWLTRYVPSIGYDVERWKWGLEVGQQIYTPADIEERRLIRTDRPYAGWLYGGVILQHRGVTSHGIGVMETWQLQVGVVGPESLADEAQIWWHDIWGFRDANGWDNQIETEVGGLLGYTRRYRLQLGVDEGLALQLLPEGGFALGNIRTEARLGGLVRVGWNIPNEFGLTDSKPVWDFGFNVFGGVMGWAVLVDIFLDGNHFRESHEVHKEPLVGEARYGLAITSRHLELSLARIHRTKDFTRQEEEDAFFSLVLTLKF